MTKLIFIISIFAAQIHVANAQDPQLFEHPWYLQNINIEGVGYNAPSNGEVINVPLNFYSSNNHLETTVCNSAEGEVVFSQSEENFEILGLSITLIMCNEPDNNIFENRYFQDFFDVDFNLDNPYGYEIIQGSGDDKQLIITSAAGNTATYNNFKLSVPKQKLIAFKIFPNPVSEQLSIISKQLPITKIMLYDVRGLVLEKFTIAKTNAAHLDVSGLSSGLYFVQITSEENKTQTTRFIKQ